MAVLGRAFSLFLVLIVLTGAVGVLLFLRTLFGLILLILILLVGVVAQLIAIAKIRDHLARQPCEIGLIGEAAVEPLQRAARLILNKAAPKLHGVLGAYRQRTPGGEMAHHIARRDRERHVTGLFGLIVALAQRVMFDLYVDIARRAGHVARAHRLATRGFHRLIQLACHLALGRITGMGRVIVIAAVQRQRIGGAAGQ